MLDLVIVCAIVASGGLLVRKKEPPAEKKVDHSKAAKWISAHRTRIIRSADEATRRRTDVLERLQKRSELSHLAAEADDEVDAENRARLRSFGLLPANSKPALRALQPDVGKIRAARAAERRRRALKQLTVTSFTDVMRERMRSRR